MQSSNHSPSSVSLIATLPQGALVATSLGVEALGWHRSPGSAKHFNGRAIFLELPHQDGKPAFKFLEEGGWRDPERDTAAALKAALSGKKTKTALSNNALQCIGIDAVSRAYLVKTSGRALELQSAKELLRFQEHTCDEELTLDQVAEHVHQPSPTTRNPRFYMVLAPLEMLVLSSLTPTEYAWYATHRPGKVFRHMAFTEITGLAKRNLVSEGVLVQAITELTTKHKKTKTLMSGDLLNQVPFQDWAGVDGPEQHALYLADRNHLVSWRFPQSIPSQWIRAEG